MPASTSTTPEISSTDSTPASAVVSSTTPPKTGIAAPHTPLRPPATVSGTRAMLQARATAATCSVVDGRTTASAIWGTSPAIDQWSASGHQSRLASATWSVVGDHLADRAQCSEEVVGELDPVAAEVRRVAGQLNGWRWRRVHRRPPLRRTAPGSARSVRRSWRRPSRVRPASSSATSGAAASDAARSSRWARVRRHRTSSSVVAISWRTAWTASARRYGRPGDQRLAERRIERDERPDLVRLRPVPAIEVSDRSIHDPSPRRVAGASSSARFAVPRGSSRTTASTASSAISR